MWPTYQNLVRVQSAMVLELEEIYLMPSRLEPFAKYEVLDQWLFWFLTSTYYGPWHKRFV
ncbi:MAG: hypothetical protein NPIRA03_00360 [Nitrospirales bacterium]|nr:MAG: hypothetical protein NPIRA03_00360 [Nitrospirales bacterium]